MQGFQLGQYFGTNSLAKAADLHEVMSQIRFSVKDTGIPYRHINHWDEKQLLSFDRGNNADGWRKFSFIQFIWTRLIEKMRNVEVPLPVIQKIKTSLFEVVSFRELFLFLKQNIKEIECMKIGEPEKSEMIKFIRKGDFSGFPKDAGISYLQLILAEVICDRLPISLLIYPDGYWLPFNEAVTFRYSTEDNIRITNQSCFKIPLASVLSDFITEFYNEDITVLLELITASEQLALTHIAEKKVKTIAVSQKGNDSRYEIKNKPFAEVVDFIFHNRLIGNKLKYY